MQKYTIKAWKAILEVFKEFTAVRLSKRDLETLQYDEFKRIQVLWKADLKYHVHCKAIDDDVQKWGLI